MTVLLATTGCVAARPARLTGAGPHQKAAAVRTGIARRRTHSRRGEKRGRVGGQSRLAHEPLGERRAVGRISEPFAGVAVESAAENGGLRVIECHAAPSW